jgi:DNA-binding transcriptional MocR family regulator
MELPSYTGAITAFRNVGAVMVGVSQSDDGIDIERLDQTYLALKSEGRRIKMLYLVPNFQNPTGLMLSTAKRTQALEWAGRRDILIVEDDPYRDLYFRQRGAGWRNAADRRRRHGRPGRIPEQFFKDAGAGFSRGLAERACAAGEPNRVCETGR